MAFYYGDECLGETNVEAVGKLDYGECRAVVYDYLTSDFTLEELASFILDREDVDGIVAYAEDALENLRSWADRGMNFCYGGVECVEGRRTSNRRPQQSKSTKKAPAKKTTKPKASGKKPAARSAPRRS